MNLLPKNKKISKSISILIIVCLILVSFFQTYLIKNANAVAASGYLRTDRMKINTTTGGTICFTPQTVGTEAKVTITFPGTGTQSTTSYGVNTTASNWTVTTTNIPAGSSAWPSITTASGVSGAAVTFPSGDMTVGTYYCFNFASSSTLSTPTNAGTDLTGSIVTKTSGDAAIDTVNFATAVISDDQIAVTATVPATFSFALGANSAALGTLSSSSVNSASGVTVTVSTNANNGWLAWVKSANGALSSASTSDTIPSGTYTSGAGNIVDLSGTSGYVLDANATTGSPTIDAAYDGTNTTSGGHIDTIYEQFASKSTPVSGNVVTLIVRAKASATNKAATDYADTLTVVGAGQF